LKIKASVDDFEVITPMELNSVGERKFIWRKKDKCKLLTKSSNLNKSELDSSEGILFIFFSYYSIILFSFAQQHRS
jgi:hypothetical protein